jgi:outer membrane protein insertion porin family
MSAVVQSPPIQAQQDRLSGDGSAPAMQGSLPAAEGGGEDPSPVLANPVKPSSTDGSGVGSGTQAQGPGASPAEGPRGAQEQKSPARKQGEPTAQQDEKEKPKAPASKKEETTQEPSKLQLETPETAPQPETQPPAPGTPGQPAPLIKPVPIEEQKQVLIEDIIFRGNRRIPAATLRARVFSHQGDVYDENALERDFMALWNTGFLDDIRCEVIDGEKGKIVTFYVREKKLVRSIDYKGLNTVQQSDVLDEFKKRKVGLSIQSQYDPVVVKRAQVVLQDLLAAHGRQFATVRSRTRSIPPNSVALLFVVAEGPKVKIGDIRFDGNKVFSDNRLVRSMKYSRPAGAPPWFYWFHKTYDKDKILADLELNVRTLYQDNGYFYVVLKEPVTKMTDTKNRWPFFFFGWGRGKRVDVTIPVEEGDQYRLGRLVIRGNKLFKQAQIEPILRLKTGDIFNLGKVRKSIENYQKLYGAYGYINFTATPDIEPDTKKKIINLALDFEEEKQYFVHRIEFSGNTKTRDKVIRRELLLDEGNIFSSELWDLSVLRVNQLGFFDQIKKEDYDIKQNRKDSTVDVLVKVKEKGRNSIGFSGGVSGLAGSFVGLNYATNNFLGLGETLSLQFQWGTYQRMYSFGFTEPYLFDRPITTGFTIFKSEYHFDQLRQLAAYSGTNLGALTSLGYGSYTQNFQQNSSGFTTFASYPLRRSFARLGLTYSYNVSSVETFSASSQLYFQALAFSGYQGPNQLRGITTSQVTPNLLYNTLDAYMNPTRGKYIYAALGFSGSILGGNVNTIQPIVEVKYFHPVNRGRHVLAMRFKGAAISGYGGRVPPPFSRFYMGGEEDLRGFNIYSVSPAGLFPTIGTVCNRDSSGNPLWKYGSDGNPTSTCGSSSKFPYNTLQFSGGDTELLTNVEYRIPIATPLTLAYFVDFGGSFIFRPGQLKIQRTALSSISEEFPYFPLPGHLQPISGTNRPRGSTGVELQAMLPVLNVPFRVYVAYNWLALNTVMHLPQDLPPESLFPNVQTYNQALTYFAPLRIQDRRFRVGFTVTRTF